MDVLILRSHGSEGAVASPIKGETNLNQRIMKAIIDWIPVFTGMTKIDWVAL